MAFVTAPLGRRDNFPYRKLEYREIRLVVVKKHSHWPRENSLTCSIQYMTLPEDSTAPIAYTALSYTWGDGKDVTSLKLLDESTRNSGEITVTSSLVSALQTILEPGKRHALWIDQICINQSSPEEKGQQVQLMRWIYERAASVHVWLGPAAEDSDEAMLYLDKNDSASLARDLADSSRTRLNSRIRLALENLFSRSYWTRTWTLQEASALRSLQASISCGHKSVHLGRVFDWVAAGNSSANAFSEQILQVQGTGVLAMYFFWHMRRRSAQALMILVNAVRNLIASDPRDKVYSMLNFATDIRGSGIKPDYTKTVRQTYTELVLWSIGTYQRLDVLGDCHPSLTDDAAPSWVPDWNEQFSITPFFKISDSIDPESIPLYRASGEYIRDLKLRHLDVDTRLLSLSGVRVADVTFVLNTVPPEYDSWAVQKTWQPQNGNTICPLNLIPMRKVFRRTMYLDISRRKDGNWLRGNALPLPWDMKGLVVSPEEAWAIENFRRMSHGRRSFYTRPCAGSSQGLLCLSVNTTRSGDELWILKGGKMPFILRPKAMTISHTDLETGEASELPVDAGMPTYELVGEAFVLGLMDGEIIDMLGELPKRERPAPLSDMDREFRKIGLI
jgi:hypothetical protein